MDYKSVSVHGPGKKTLQPHFFLMVVKQEKLSIKTFRTLPTESKKNNKIF